MTKQTLAVDLVQVDLADGSALLHIALLQKEPVYIKRWPFARVVAASSIWHIGRRPYPACEGSLRQR